MSSLQLVDLATTKTYTGLYDLDPEHLNPSDNKKRLAIALAKLT